MKLHLGCGKRDFGPEWIHIDGADFPHIKSHDITKLDFEENTVDLIYSRKIFQTNFPFETKTTFQEFSSKVRLVVMDLDSFFNFFM